ncbi:FtsX-like permease family protein [Flavobacteriaceae bacterium R38]|nr:FtsX-like permease family protein [Flavobacteriaceae bacterium R38]
MLKHNLIIFLRNIKKYKSTFVINLIGLSSGLACVLLITLWVLDELEVDKFHENDASLYQIWNKFNTPEGVRVMNWTPTILAQAMKDQLPEVKYASGQTLPEWFEKTPLHVDGKTIKASGIFADDDYFKMFSYPFIEGNKDQVLNDINTIAISESLAKKLFNTSEGVIGKVIEWDILNTKGNHQISGVFKDVPGNSTTQFDFVLPYDNWKKVFINAGGEIDWVSNNPATYIVLKEGTNAAAFASKIENFSKLQDDQVTADLVMTKYSSNYLFGNFKNGKQASGRMNYVYLFSIIALFILIIACINFMNLSTANASRRLKEIGVKKALGSKRGTLIKQYFSESVLTSFGALFIALLLVFIFLPAFNDITGKSLALNFNLFKIGLIILIVFFTGILAGSYPALHLSRFNPIATLKGQLKNSWSEIWIRKGLVVFQFSLSIVLIIGVLLVTKQIQYVQSKNLGMDKDNVIYFGEEGNLGQNTEVFLKEINAISGVVNAATTSQNIIGTDINTTAGLMWTGNQDEKNSRFNELRIGYDFIETMDMKVKEGRSFSREFRSDSTAVVFNEAAIKMMGLKDPIGKTVSYGGIDYKIAGVLEDFHFKSLREVVNPMFFRLERESRPSQFVVRIAQGKERETLSKIKETYVQFNPGYSFDYTFLDTDFQSQYAAEQQVASLSKYFAGLAILISCLGLFGLAAFTAERRRKEIGIRKTLGQSKSQIMFLLSSEFAKLVGIAMFIGIPVAFLLSQNWLSGFAYKIKLELWYFLATGCVALLIALLTVSTQTIKAVANNPVDALREE